MSDGYSSLKISSFVDRGITGDGDHGFDLHQMNRRTNQDRVKYSAYNTKTGRYRDESGQEVGPTCNEFIGPLWHDGGRSIFSYEPHPRNFRDIVRTQAGTAEKFWGHWSSEEGVFIFSTLV